MSNPNAELMLLRDKALLARSEAAVYRAKSLVKSGTEEVARNGGSEYEVLRLDSHDFDKSWGGGVTLKGPAASLKSWLIEQGYKVEIRAGRMVRICVVW